MGLGFISLLVISLFNNHQIKIYLTDLDNVIKFTCSGKFANVLSHSLTGVTSMVINRRQKDAQCYLEHRC